MVVFEERGTRSTRRKPLGAEKRTNKLNPHIAPDLGIEPGPHWWQASALTTALSLYPNGLWKSIVPGSEARFSFSPSLVYSFANKRNSSFVVSVCLSSY